MIEDLKIDQEVLSKHIENVKTGTLMMDSVISILNNPSQVAENAGPLYYLGRLVNELSLK